MRPSYIVIHHSATPDGRTFDAEAIRRFHTSWRHEGRIITPEEAGIRRARGELVIPPWRDAGYHFFIERVGDGSRPQGVLGRPMTMVGAHCVGRNQDSIGICVVGNYDQGEPDPELLDYLVAYLIKPLMAVFAIPKERLLFHREMAPKTCPGSRLTKDMILSRL